MVQISGFYQKIKVKACFDCKMFDVANWVARLNGEDSPRGKPIHETLSVAPQRDLEISAFTGHPPFLGRDHFSLLRVVAKSPQS